MVDSSMPSFTPIYIKNENQRELAEPGYQKNVC